jgi:hypothetical protein
MWLIFGIILFLTLLCIAFFISYETINGFNLKPIDLNDQPADTVQIINNTSESPFHVFLEYANYNGMTLLPPTAPWKILSSTKDVILSDPKHYYPTTDLPTGITNAINPVAIGSATWQELIMPNKGDIAILKIPNFTKQAWSIRPLKFHSNGKPCQGSEKDCGMPILIESGRDMVGDMSAVDGVNFLLRYEFTTKNNTTSIMDFKTNPCKAVGLNPKGCVNPAVDGIFDPSKNWLSNPCPAGTCNLIGDSKKWCDAVNDGQCANSSSHWTDAQRGSGGPDSCTKNNLFTTYCYSHNDATSSPYLAAPYKMKLTYSDLL